MRAIECMLTHEVQKVSPPLLHRAVSFPDETDSFGLCSPSLLICLLWQPSLLLAGSVGSVSLQSHLSQEKHGGTGGGGELGR